MPHEAEISKAKLFAEVDYTPHSPEQWAIHNSASRFRIPCCGRRWGKSISIGHELTYSLFIPNTFYWIVGPTYKLGEKEFRVVYDDIVRKLKFGKEVKKSYNVKQGDMRIQMPWNSILEVVSAEKNDSLVGEGLDGACMSEAALHKQNTWDQFIEPALSDKLGWAVFPSTPRGFNWYQGLWQLGQIAEIEDYESWRLPTWTNPVRYPGGLQNEEIQRLKERVSDEYFRQEYGAEFTTFEGQIYSEFDPRKHVTSIKYNPSWRNFQVFDFGFSDPFVALDIMVDETQRVYVWREYVKRHMTTGQHGVWLRDERDNPDQYHIDGWFGDPKGADEIATLALILGPIIARTVSWEKGIEAVKRQLKLRPDGTPGLYIDPSCTELIRQLSNLRFKTSKEGFPTREGQHDYDDHGPDALRYFHNEFFVLGAGTGLGDIYSEQYLQSEAATFFQLRGGTVLDDTIEF